MGALRYWTPERAVELAEAMKSLAFRENGGWFFGHQGIMPRLTTLLSQHESLKDADAGQGLNLLVFTGVIEPGKTGRKKTNYRRAFYPDKVSQITEDDITRFMISRRAGRRS